MYKTMSLSDNWRMKSWEQFATPPYNLIIIPSPPQTRSVSKESLVHMTCDWTNLLPQNKPHSNANPLQRLMPLCHAINPPAPCEQDTLIKAGKQQLTLVSVNEELIIITPTTRTVLAPTHFTHDDMLDLVNRKSWQQQRPKGSGGSGSKGKVTRVLNPFQKKKK